MQLIHLSLSQEKIFENQDVFSFPILVYFYETNIGILCYIGIAIFLYVGISILYFTTLLKIYAILVKEFQPRFHYYDIGKITLNFLTILVKVYPILGIECQNWYYNIIT